MRFANSKTSLAVLLAFVSALPSAAHEFWIDPVAFSVETGAPVQANLRVGQDFEGNAMAYVPRHFTRFDFALSDTISSYEGQLAARPAFDLDVDGDGLGIVLIETSTNRLTYNEWARFLRFADHKDFEDIEVRHLSRGLPQEGFIESYTRHAKSLIALGAGAGEDQQFGLMTEFVALANPYTEDLSGGMPLQLFFDGAPQPDRQVELFDRAPDGSVEITLHRTDETGQVILPVTGGHIYMIDAVTLVEVEPGIEAGPVWHTYWANLTFSVP